jgi:hypothetical protein
MAVRYPCRCAQRDSSTVPDDPQCPQMHSQIQALQESLRMENAALFAFLTDVGRFLGHMQLTQAMFATGGQDIFTYCQTVHCHMLMLNSSGGASASLSQQPGVSGICGSDRSSSQLPGCRPSVSWFGGAQPPHGSLPLSERGSIPLQDNYMIRCLTDSQGIDLDVAQALQIKAVSMPPSSHSPYDACASAADNTAERGQKRPASPTPHHKALMHDSPFIYGPGGGDASGAATVATFRGPSVGAAVSAAGAEFRPAKVCKTDPTQEAAVANIATPSERQDSFLELFHSCRDGRQPDPLRLSAGLRTLLRDAQAPGGPDGAPPSSMLPTAAALASPRNPAELLDTLGQMSSPAMKGIMSLLTSQGAHLQAGMAGGAASPHNPPSTIISELESLLNSKEGSRTLDRIAQDLTVSRTLSAGEFMNLPLGGEPSATPTPRPEGAVEGTTRSEGVKLEVSVAPLSGGVGPVISSVQPIAQRLPQSTAPITSGQHWAGQQHL